MLFTYFSFIKLFYFNNIIYYFIYFTQTKNKTWKILLYTSCIDYYTGIYSQYITEHAEMSNKFFAPYIYMGALFFQTQTNRRTISTPFLLKHTKTNLPLSLSFTFSINFFPRHNFFLLHSNILPCGLAYLYCLQIKFWFLEDGLCRQGQMAVAFPKTARGFRTPDGSQRNQRCTSGRNARA